VTTSTLWSIRSGRCGVAESTLWVIGLGRWLSDVAASTLWAFWRESWLPADGTLRHSKFFNRKSVTGCRSRTLWAAWQRRREEA